jgi:vacuolar-type H+-ATPase subunit E/Vma4
METETKELQEVKQMSNGFIEQAKIIAVIGDDNAYNLANDYINKIAQRKKEIKSKVEPSKKATHEAWKRVCELEGEAIKPLDEALYIIKNGMANYYADRQARIDAEQKELIAQAQAKAEADRKKQLEQAQTTEERKQLEATPVIPTNVIEVENEKLAGIKPQETYNAEVFDFKELVKAVAIGNVPLDMLLPNQKELDKVAKALKDNMKFNGVRVIKSLIVKAKAKY